MLKAKNADSSTDVAVVDVRDDDFAVGLPRLSLRGKLIIAVRAETSSLLSIRQAPPFRMMLRAWSNV